MAPASPGCPIPTTLAWTRASRAHRPYPAPPPSAAGPLALGLLLVGVALGVAAFAVAQALTPPPALLSESRTVEIPPQHGVLDIGRMLEAAGVIRSGPVFVGLAVLRGTARSLKAGEYEVPAGSSLLATLQLLEAGRVKPHLIVLPEGFSACASWRAAQIEAEARAEDVLRVAGSRGSRRAWASRRRDSRGTCSRIPTG